MATHLHIDASSGCAGDMLLGALVDAGASAEALRETLARLVPDPFRIEIEDVLRSGVRCTALTVREDKHEHAHGHGDHGHGDGHGHHHHHGPARTLPDMLAVLEDEHLPAAVRERAAAVFRAVAEAEASVHGAAPEEVHFHEVSGLDTIVDVVGVCLALDLLGVETVSVSSVGTGTGFVDCAHGRLPVPVPATAELLRGLPVTQIDSGCELCTPTGAALLRVLGAGAFGVAPPMRIDAIGWGAGARDPDGRVNAVRVLLGATDADGDRDTVTRITTAVDDASGETLGWTLERLLEAGALDAYARHLLMKKGRPGVEVVVLCRPDDRDVVLETLLRGTGAFGARVETVERVILRRDVRTVAVDGREIRIKTGRRGDSCVVVAPEYEDCARAARETGRPFREIRDAAVAAAGAERKESPS